jgi:hypothetical protein
MENVAAGLVRQSIARERSSTEDHACASVAVGNKTLITAASSRISWALRINLVAVADMPNLLDLFIFLCSPVLDPIGLPHNISRLSL